MLIIRSWIADRVSVVREMITVAQCLSTLIKLPAAPSVRVYCLFVSTQLAIFMLQTTFNLLKTNTRCPRVQWYPVNLVNHSRVGFPEARYRGRIENGGEEASPWRPSLHRWRHRSFSRIQLQCTRGFVLISGAESDEL